VIVSALSGGFYDTIRDTGERREEREVGRWEEERERRLRRG
jgi:hypothetical protein